MGHVFTVPGGAGHVNNMPHKRAMNATFGRKTHPLGFVQVDPLPTQEELACFYREQYFQTANSVSNSYDQEYTSEEYTYFENRGLVCEHIWRSCQGERTGRFFDVGCGEGFLVDFFHKRGWQVQCCDFSSYAITKHHPHLLDHFAQGDIFEHLERKLEQGETFDLINLANVLEHVREPLDLLSKLQRLLSKGGLIRLIVPNDFSPLQEMLVAKGITAETWFGPPDHLAYFTFDSLKRLLAEIGFTIKTMMADFPIEVFLFNEHSNYWKDRAKGKQAHLTRVCCGQLLGEPEESTVTSTTWPPRRIAVSADACMLI